MKKKDNRFFPGLYHISRVYIIGVCLCACTRSHGGARGDCAAIAHP